VYACACFVNGTYDTVAGGEQVEPLVKWALALPLRVFATSFGELQVQATASRCAFGFFEVKAMWPSDVMRGARDASDRLFSRLEVAPSGRAALVTTATSRTQTARRLAGPQV
jgi:hypothetical protein